MLNGGAPYQHRSQLLGILRLRSGYARPQRGPLQHVGKFWRHGRFAFARLSSRAAFGRLPPRPLPRLSVSCACAPDTRDPSVGLCGSLAGNGAMWILPPLGAVLARLLRWTLGLVEMTPMGMRVILQVPQKIACRYKAAGTDARRMKMKCATSRKAGGSRHFRKAQQGGLGIRCQSDTKIFLKMLGSPAFSKTLAYSVQWPTNLHRWRRE